MPQLQQLQPISRSVDADSFSFDKKTGLNFVQCWTDPRFYSTRSPSLDSISIEFNPCLNFNSVESDLVMREIFDRLANIQTQLFTKSVSPLLFDECLAWPTFRQFMLELLQKSTHSGTVRPKIQTSKL